MNKWILYYSHNSLPVALEIYFQKRLLEVKGESKICSVIKNKRHNFDFADIEIVCNEGDCAKNNWKSILGQMNMGIDAILEQDENANVSIAEHDVLYPKGYFDLVAPKNTILKNVNYYFTTPIGYRKGNAWIHSQTICSAKLYKHCLNETKDIEIGRWFKNEKAGVYKLEKFNYESPVLDIRHDKNYTGERNSMSRNDYLNTVDYWGSHREVYQEVKKRMSEIIIVGNGSSILDNNNGDVIDSFNNVVRFNSYKTKGFENHTGAKTDIWFTVNKTHIKEAKEYKKVYVHSWEHSELKCKITQDIRKEVDAIKIDKDFIKTIPIKCPSTGLIAIYYFIEKYGSVTITGFDWWDREEHHYGDKEVRGTLHKPKEEYKLIKEKETNHYQGITYKARISFSGIQVTKKENKRF